MADFIIQLVPLFIVGVIIAGVIAPIVKRKGRSPWLALVGLVPLVGPFYLLYVISLTDQAVLDRLARLENQIGHPTRGGSQQS